MELIDALCKLLAAGFLLSVSWNASEGKRYAKEARDQLASKQNKRPEHVIACPYGYGECEAFPFGTKPCKAPHHSADGPAEEEARCGDDEAPPVP